MKIPAGRLQASKKGTMFNFSIHFIWYLLVFVRAFPGSIKFNCKDYPMNTPVRSNFAVPYFLDPFYNTPHRGLIHFTVNGSIFIRSVIEQLSSSKTMLCYQVPTCTAMHKLDADSSKTVCLLPSTPSLSHHWNVHYWLAFLWDSHGNPGTPVTPNACDRQCWTYSYSRLHRQSVFLEHSVILE